MRVLVRFGDGDGRVERRDGKLVPDDGDAEVREGPVKEITITLKVDRRAAMVCLALFMVAVPALRLSSETLSLTTVYPSPVGVYNQVITTGNGGAAPADTTLNRGAGNTVLVPPTNAAGRVGIGTATPAAKLDVAGTMKLADGTQGAGKVLSSDAAGNASWQYCTYAP